MTRHSHSARSRAVVAVVIGLLVAVGAAGCSESKTVHIAKIGVIAPLDGGLVQFGRGIRNSVQLAVDQANQRNRLPGWHYEVDAMDDSSDPAKGEAAARRLAADPAVVGVVGTYNSGVAAKVAPVLGTSGIVMISPGNTDTTLTLGPDPANPKRPNTNYFRMVAADAVQAPFLAKAAISDFGARQVAVVSETKPVSKGLADTFAADLVASGGTVDYTRVVPDGTTDFTEVVDQIARLPVDLVFFGGEYDVGAALAKELADARARFCGDAEHCALPPPGLSAPLMGGDGIKDDAYIAKGGRAGDLASTVGAPLATLESAKSYVNAYTAAKFAEPPSDFGVYAFDAANVVIAASTKVLAGATSVTPQARAGIVAAVQQTDTSGASGRVAFDPFGDTRTRVLTLYRVDAGQASAAESGAAWKPIKTEAAT